MLAPAPLDIAALVKNRRPNHTLAGPFYTSRDIFNIDIDVIFARHWIFVANEPEISEPGDYVRIDIGHHSVIITRNEELQVTAFHNVCRHRGARLVNGERGFVGNIVCPYHQWTYDLEGRLIHAEGMGKDFDPACYGLKKVHVRSVSGLIFICLAEVPPADFDDMAARMTPYLAPHNIAQLKVAKQIDLIENGNWKLTMENNRECYHCGGHPELSETFFKIYATRPEDVTEAERGDYEYYVKSTAEFETIWAREGLLHKAIEELDERPTGFRTERLALDKAGESYTLDTKVACKKLTGDYHTARLGTLHFHTQPNSWHHFLSDHAVTFSVIPLSADQTLVRTTWMVHKDAVEGVDYDVDNLTRVWLATNQQDCNFVEYAQRGVASPAYEPGPYSGPEYQVNMFANWYIARLKAQMAGNV